MAPEQKRRQSTLNFTNGAVEFTDATPKRRYTPKSRDAVPTRQDTLSSWVAELPCPDAEPSTPKKNPPYPRPGFLAREHASPTESLLPKRPALSEHRTSMLAISDNPSNPIVDNTSSESARQLDVWVGDGNHILLVEDTTSLQDVTQTWVGADNGAILLEGGEYLDTKGMTEEEVNCLVGHDLKVPSADMMAIGSATVISPSSSELRRQVFKALTDSTPDLDHFLNLYLLADDREGVDALFDEFQQAEAKLSGWNPRHLVRPSGSFHSSLHIQLHYPTFKTRSPNDGEVADNTNCCIKHLLEKGLSVDNAFWYESYFRRIVAATVRHQDNVTESWPITVRTLHEDFCRRLQQLPKKVLLLFGAFNRKVFNSNHQVVEFDIKIDNELPVKLGIVRDEQQEIKFIVIYLWHPEYVLHNWTHLAARIYDNSINVAAALAGVDIDTAFYTRRSISAKSHILEEIAFKNELRAVSEQERQTNEMQPLDQFSDETKSYLKKRLVDSTNLHNLYRSGFSIAAHLLHTMAKTPDIKRLRFERRVQYWAGLPDDHYSTNCRAIVAAAQRDDAIPTIGILARPSMHADRSQTYFYRPSNAARTLNTPQIPVASNPIDPVGNLPPGVTIRQKVSKSKNTIINSAVIHEGRSISLKCIKCGISPARKPVDEAPEFCTISHAAGRYIARAQVCITPECQKGWKAEYGRSGRRQIMVPQDESIAYIRSDQLQELDY